MDEAYKYLSTLEKKVYNWLTKNKVPFVTQQQMFGYREIGSATVDFILPLQNIALRCMGGYWHSGLEANARDELGKERLMNEGYIVVDLQEKDLSDTNIDRTMRMALRGEEVL